MSARPATEPMVTVENLTVSHRRHPAVHHLACQFAAGSLTAVVGPNGAGKSSLLDALVGKLRPTTGRIRLALPRRTPPAYLPQQSTIDRSYPLRVEDVVMLGAWAQFGLFGAARSAVARRAGDALEQVGLPGLGRRLVGELSVGQFQRLLFARLLMQDSPLILLDEPFNAIDSRTTADLLRLVQRWHAEGRTVLAVLHDLDQVRAHFPRTLLLAREGLAHGPTAEVLTDSNLLRARVLAEQWDESAAWCRRDERDAGPEAPLAARDLHAAHGHGHAHAHAHAHTHTHAPAHAHAHGQEHAHPLAHGPSPSARPVAAEALPGSPR